MMIKIPRAQMIATTINAWLDSGTIKDEEVEYAVLALNEEDTETLLHIMIEASQNRLLNLELLEDFGPVLEFNMN